MEEIYVNQVLSTIQGEGINIGTPCILLRTSYCNLKCPFCDTKYSWKHPSTGIIITNKNIKKLKFGNNKNLLLTGGEPLIYAKLNLFWKLLNKLWNTIDIETNGVLINDRIISQLSKLHATVNLIIGVKTNQNCYNTKDEFEDLIETLKHLDDSINVYLKFVHSIDEEATILNIIKELKNINRKQIFLMPLTPNPNKYKNDCDFMLDMKKNNLKTAEFCINNDLRMTPRLQYYLYPKGSIDEFGNFQLL